MAAHVAVGGATEVQELSTDESMTLLRLLAPGVVEREVQKAQTLVQAVGGLPLALTLMGNYLRKQAYSGQSRRITAALERRISRCIPSSLSLTSCCQNRRNRPSTPWPSSHPSPTASQRRPRWSSST